jgi:hypothetical protein
LDTHAPEIVGVDSTLSTGTSVLLRVLARQKAILRSTGMGNQVLGRGLIRWGG